MTSAQDDATPTRPSGSRGLGGGQEQFGVSLPVGLALLRDVDGNIVLPVSLETTEDETTLQLGPVFLNAFRSALRGAITSPLKLLNAAVPYSEGRDSPGKTSRSSPTGSAGGGAMKRS